jgi:hypothetical protein
LDGFKPQEPGASAAGRIVRAAILCHYAARFFGAGEEPEIHHTPAHREAGAA